MAKVRCVGFMCDNEIEVDQNDVSKIRYTCRDHMPRRVKLSKGLDRFSYTPTTHCERVRTIH